MDIYINTKVDKIGQLLKENGFVIKRKKITILQCSI